MQADQVLEREYLEMRSRILDLAASLDRLDRAQGKVEDDDRLVAIRKGIEILSNSADRAKQVQMLFSREYEDNWIKEFELETRF